MTLPVPQLLSTSATSDALRFQRIIRKTVYQYYFNLFEYAIAKIAFENLMSVSGVSEKDSADFSNMVKILSFLEKTPKQVCSFPVGSSVTEASRDMAGLLRLPNELNNHAFDFIFDTGANLSVITESNSKKAGIRELGSGIAVNSASGRKVISKIGVADSMKIGSVLLKNVVFLILPDDALSLAGGVYKIPGIIGLPVIRQLQTITISSSNVITIAPGKKDKSLKQNLYFDEHNLAVDFLVKDSILHTFFFDIGAKSSRLNNHATQDFESMINRKKKVRISGAGGSTKLEVVKLNNLPLTLSSTSASIILKTINLTLSKSESISGEYYGVIGNDVLTKFNSISIDFVNMHLSLQKK